MKKIYGILFAILLATSANAQSVQQSGVVTPNTAAIWSGTGIIKDGVSATDSPLTTFGVTRDGADAICVSSARSTAVGRNQLCFQAATSGAAKISLQNYGTASAQNLQFVLNGVTLTLPSGGGTFLTGTGTFVAGNAACFNSTSGIIQDCGVAIAAGTLNGLPYYSTVSVISSTAAGTNGQFVVGQTSSAPLWKTLSGDVSAVTAAGAVTLNKVNGVSYSTTYTNHGVLLGQGTSAFASTVSNNTGYCLLSQGLSADPIWAACASGSGSAGGADTQVQFNSSSSLGGSANLTWVSPTLTIGVAGTTTGKLGLASSTATGTVTLQATGVATAYNFNYPTGAGTSGQPLISGGGGSTPNTFGTLGVFGGGTNCAAASGTCLDNITGFGSTGYINRTGAGTYAFSTVIPVSGGGTNLASGTSGGILGYTASGTLASSVLLTQYGLVYGGGAGATPVATAAGTNGQIPVANTSAAPAFVTLSGDITTVSAAGLVTIAANAITNAKLATALAYTFKGNVTGSTAIPTDFTMASLTQKASPAAGDYIIIADNAASGATKYATVASVASAGSVASIAGNTGAFTLTQPINNATNAIVLNATIFPQGRITLTSGTPVLTSTVSAATTVYYTPYVGNLVPIYDGTNIIPTAIAELSIVLGSNWTTNSNWDVFIASDSGTIRACTGPAWTSDTGRGTGAGTTELERISGLLLNKVTLTCRYNNTTTFSVAADRGTYIGSLRSGSAGQTNYIFGAAASGGTAGLFGVWNMYNRVEVTTTTSDTAASWTYTSAAARPSDNSTSNRFSFIMGIAEDGASVLFTQRISTTVGAGSSANVGFGLDSTTTFSAASLGAGGGVAAAFNGALTAQAALAPQLGFHFVQALEQSDGSTTTTYVGGAIVYQLTGRLRM